MTIKFGKFANFIVRNFVVVWEAPIARVTPAPHIQGKNMNKHLAKTWPQTLQKKANSSVLRQDVCSYFALYVGVGGSQRFPK